MRAAKLPECHICRRGIIVTIDIVDVPREGGNDKDLGTRSRSSRRGGGRKGRQAGLGLFNRIHLVLVKYLTGREAQR